MVEKKCFAMFCQNCQFFGCTPRLKVPLPRRDTYELNIIYGKTYLVCLGQRANPDRMRDTPRL